MKTSDPKVNQDIALLKNDVRRLRNDVVAAVHSVKSRGKDTIMESGGRIRGMFTDLGDKAKVQLHDKSERLKDRGYEAVESWRGGIEHRPVTSLLIAFAVGVVCALVLARRHHY